MERPIGVIKITWTVKTNKFSVKSNLKKIGVLDVIDSFIRAQIGKGEDSSKRSEREVYHVNIKWFPVNDDIIVTHDANNLGLREGILMMATASINAGKTKVTML